jgi:hypothetical protein
MDWEGIMQITQLTQHCFKIDDFEEKDHRELGAWLDGKALIILDFGPFGKVNLKGDDEVQKFLAGFEIGSLIARTAFKKRIVEAVEEVKLI